MLTSLQNPLVKQLRKLHRAKDRHEQSLFLLEGTHLIEEACATNYPIATLCHTASWQNAHPTLWEQASQQAERTELVSDAVLEAIATTVNPDGVVAAASRTVSKQRINQAIQLGIALETLQDPGNLGAVIRTAAAAGADGLWLSQDSVDLDHPKVLRASAGQWFRLPMVVSQSLPSELQQLQQQGIQVIATLPTAQLTYWQIDFSQPTVIVLGNEAAGLSPPLAQLADMAVRIPLAPGVESLNVAVAAALILYEAERQRQSSKPVDQDQA